ncbi:helix-turn-helix domain-containing protein [Mycobacterium sp. IDR2000157661]|uniref:helix-turn-helix domain-containing protein n=1 Tax=Mycobacterium sp. IDR2000157661 TaxID=2867005 RepID=UPI001EE9AF2E|nr:helix-turn-helix domain-containing protein [Mycobacterium sp. IDR2000157661]
MTGIDGKTLRFYERQGMVAPTRVRGGRRYSDDDVRRLDRITHLIQRGYVVGGAALILDHTDREIADAFEAARAAIPRTSRAIAATLQDASERLRDNGVRPDIVALDQSSMFRSRMSAIGEYWDLPRSGTLFNNAFSTRGYGTRYDLSEHIPRRIRKFARELGLTEGYVRVVREYPGWSIPYTPDKLLAVPMMLVGQTETRVGMDCFVPDLPPEPRFAASDDNRAYLVNYDPGEKGAADRWEVSDLERLLQRDFERYSA